MDCPRCALDPKEKTGPYRRSATPHIERPKLARETHPAGFEIDRCPSCGGVWLDKGELEAVEIHGRSMERPPGYQSDVERMKRAYKNAHRPETRAPEEEPPPLACPRCGEPMFPREWGISTLVIVDVCIDCRGVWLEGEELRALEHLFAGK
jgi:Zn-finger nucleic acid-binding protein